MVSALEWQPASGLPGNEWRAPGFNRPPQPISYKGRIRGAGRSRGRSASAGAGGIAVGSLTQSRWRERGLRPLPGTGPEGARGGLGAGASSYLGKTAGPGGMPRSGKLRPQLSSAA